MPSPRTIEGLSSELHLHARALGLPHPDGGMLVVEADLPPHMAETFRTLGFHAPPARAPRRITPEGAVKGRN